MLIFLISLSLRASFCSYDIPTAFVCVGVRLNNMSQPSPLTCSHHAPPCDSTLCSTSSPSPLCPASSSPSHPSHARFGTGIDSGWLVTTMWEMAPRMSSRGLSSLAGSIRSTRSNVTTHMPAGGSRTTHPPHATLLSARPPACAYGRLTPLILRSAHAVFELGEVTESRLVVAARHLRLSRRDVSEQLESGHRTNADSGASILKLESKRRGVTVKILHFVGLTEETRGN